MAARYPAVAVLGRHPRKRCAVRWLWRARLTRTIGTIGTIGTVGTVATAPRGRMPARHPSRAALIGNPCEAGHVERLACRRLTGRARACPRWWIPRCAPAGRHADVEARCRPAADNRLRLRLDQARDRNFEHE